MSTNRSWSYYHMDKVRWQYWINRSCEEGMMTDYICLDRTQAIISFIPDQPSGFHRELWLPVPFNLANPLWGFISISGFHHNYTRPTLYGFATITLCQNFATFIGNFIFPRHYIWPTFSIFYREFWLSPILHLTNPMWLTRISVYCQQYTSSNIRGFQVPLLLWSYSSWIYSYL